MATPTQNDRPIAHGQPPNVSTWTWAFRIVRWSTYLAAFVTLILVLHKAPPPAVQTSPQAAARVEEKFQEVEKSVSQGQPATMRMDSTELNSYLASHLELQGSAPEITNPAANPTSSTSPAPSAADIEQMRSNVRDVKVELVEDRVRAYVVFNVHGKDMTLQLEGHLRSENGYLRFEPISGQIGAMPLPQSALQAAVDKMMDSPENREKLKLPADISGLQIQNGEVVTSYK
jgi:uncharacterized protein YpmS